MKKTTFMTQAAMIAAVYVVLTYIFAPISFGNVQVRISEALCVLPLFTPAAIPGLYVGCLVGNILGGGILPDIIFGSLATLAGAVGTYALRKQKPCFGALCPVVSNTLIVPLILRFGYGIELPFYLLMLMIGIGELISCFVLGLLLYSLLKKYRSKLF